MTSFGKRRCILAYKCNCVHVCVQDAFIVKFPWADTYSHFVFIPQEYKCLPGQWLFGHNSQTTDYGDVCDKEMGTYTLP
jgi:hypothetical protein